MLWLIYAAALLIAVVVGGVSLFGQGVNDVDSTPRDATIERLLRESGVSGRSDSAPHDSVIERLVRERSDG